jgi:hypothetical protein
MHPDRVVIYMPLRVIRLRRDRAAQKQQQDARIDSHIMRLPRDAALVKNQKTAAGAVPHFDLNGGIC